MLVNAVQRALRIANLELHRSSSATNEPATIRRLLAQHAVSCVLDVGANTGQYATQLRGLGYRGRIVSFEALSEAHAALTLGANGDEQWVVAPRAAVGAEDGEVEINIAGNSVSSSVLPMLEACVSAAPQARYVRSEKTPLRRLDELAAKHLKSDDRLFLKIDTQGYEAQVLAGAAGLIERVCAIQSEVSLTPLYDGAPTIESMISLVKSLGFEPYSIAPGFSDKTSGRLLQCDVFFVRAA